MPVLELDDMSLNLLGMDGRKEEDAYEDKVQTETEEEDDKTSNDSKPADDSNEKQKAASQTKEGTGSDNVINEFAKLLKDKGVLGDLDIDDINDEDGLTEAIRKVIDNGISDRNKSLEKALRGGMEPTDIQRYESVLERLGSIKKDALEEEGENADQLREWIIYNDLLTKGFSEDKAKKQLKRIFDAGDDVDEAKDALESIKNFYAEKYNAELKAAKDADEAFNKKMSEESESLHNSILKDDMLGGIETDSKTRNKIWDIVSKPSVKAEDGNYYTELQNYERNHRAEFLKHVGFFYAMTDGFKNMDKLIKSEVNKEYNKKVSKFEDMLKRGQKTAPEGNLQYMSETPGNMTLENLKKLVENRK